MYPHTTPYTTSSNSSFKKVIQQFETKNHLSFIKGIHERNYYFLIYSRLESHIKKNGFKDPSTLYQKVRLLNKEIDIEMLQSDYPTDLVFKYQKLISYLIDIKVKGEAIDKEVLRQYVEDKIIDKLENHKYLEKFKGGEFRYFIDQEIEYRILDGIRKQRNTINDEVCTDASTIGDRFCMDDPIFQNDLFQTLFKKFYYYFKTLRTKDKLEMKLCLGLLYGVPISSISQVTLVNLRNKDTTLVALSKEKTYQLLSSILSPLNNKVIKADALRKRFEKRKKTVWSILFVMDKPELNKKAKAEREHIFELLIHYYFQKEANR